jgi:hypothetical protein
MQFPCSSHSSTVYSIAKQNLLAVFLIILNTSMVVVSAVEMYSSTKEALKDDPVQIQIDKEDFDPDEGMSMSMASSEFSSLPGFVSSNLDCGTKICSQCGGHDFAHQPPLFC